VIVQNLDIFGSAIAPHEADAELVVHANAVLPGPRPGELLEPVARRRSQIVERCRGR